MALLRIVIATVWAAAFFGGDALDPRTWEDCHVDVPERCSCFEWFNATIGEVDHEDVKQMYKAFAKRAHPDKRRGDDKAKWQAIFIFGQSCYEFLRDDDFLKAYMDRVKAKVGLADRRKWSSEKFGDSMEELHIEFGIGSSSGFESIKPRFKKRESPIEKMHLFLDNSVSMQGRKLEEAKELIEEIMPRLERTPTFVHLIGPREHTKQLFSDEDDFMFDDISSKWTAPEVTVQSCDLLVLMDVTASMCEAIDSARQKVVEVAEGLRAKFKVLRVGFVGYRDIEDGHARFSIRAFTTDVGSIRNHLMGLEAGGGGDRPEDVVGALEEALRFSWSSGQRMLVHIADAPGHPPRGGQRSVTDILSDVSASGIEYTMLLIGSYAQDMADSYSSLYNAKGPPKPMKVMAVEECSPDIFKQTVMDAAFEATPLARGTFLWEYVFESIKSNPGRDQEIVIVTDGYDNDSNERFRGTNGFNHMMELLASLGIALPRITVYCIGNEDCTKARYRELAQASGGDYFASSDPGAKRAFVSHMLLTHAERLAKAVLQKRAYAQLTEGKERFDWFVPAVLSSTGSALGQVERRTCKEVDGARVCSRKA